MGSSTDVFTAVSTPPLHYDRPQRRDRNSADPDRITFAMATSSSSSKPADGR